MFKTETHLHVHEVSPCAELNAQEMVDLYHKAGYKTLIVTDHFHEGCFRLWGDLSWEEKVDRFLIGYKKTKAAAEKFDMNVLLAAEITFNYSDNDYLVYGIDETFLKKDPNILNMPLDVFHKHANENGVIVVQAHPYRGSYCTPTPSFVDGIEVYNSNPRHENYTEKTIQIAREFNKPMTAGSDAHRVEDVGLSGVVTEMEIRTMDDYVKALMSGELKMIKGDAFL